MSENMEKEVDEVLENTAQEQTQAEDHVSEDAQTDVKTEETAANEDATEQEETASGTEKKDKKDLLIEELNDRVRRQMAEFDNFRKRSEKEKSGMFEMGAKSVIEQLLPVVDNFERGLAAVAPEQKEDPFVTGMDKIYRQMQEMLEKLGVKAIEAVGCEFNPEFHNAVMHVEDEEAGDNRITEEFLKGYTYKDHVVRHSMVKVAN